jgi:hypothetical protein
MLFVDFKLLEELKLISIDEPEHRVEEQYQQWRLRKVNHEIKLRIRQQVTLWQQFADCL